jgi:hypothetical protein
VFDYLLFDFYLIYDMDTPNFPFDLNAVMQPFVNQMAHMADIIQGLQAQIEDLRSSATTRMNDTPDTETPVNENLPPRDEPTNPPRIERSPKFPDPLIYGGKREDLRPFVSGLRDKLEANADWYDTEKKKVAYAMTRLKDDAARVMNSFYRNGTFTTVEAFISLLEQSYDDASREHTCTTKLENLRQKNREFTSFFSEFLGLVGELDWNESARVAALRRSISDEIRAQLIGKDLPKTLNLFATMCQRIDEDLRFNHAAKSLKSNTPRTYASNRTASNRTNTSKPAQNSSTTEDPMDIDATRTRSYAPVGSDERKDRLTKGACFGCGLKGHLHKDCPTNPFRKMRLMNSSAPPSEHEGVNLRVPALKKARSRVSSFSESENESS